MTGTLRVVATPIGNLDDLSPRAARALADADIIACEDTRVTRALLTRAPSRARLVPLHAQNERRRAPELVRAIAAGARVALVSDAGTPGMSDPGQRLVAACVEAGLPVETVPGPSALVAALVVSGLPTARFVFEGFLPRTGSSRRRRLEALAREGRTIVLFESPHRIAESIEAMIAVLGDRRAALARELTKIHEEVVRARLSEIMERVRESPPRGEITLVVEGVAPEEAPADPGRLAARALALVEEGVPKKEAIARVAAEAGVPKRAVYQAVLDAEREE
ncbi:MAG: 16S rRNA (cytidine(1402)-2'-O)-methyltransferase [Acidobacteria bacterium]|nr:16S rRNA (cytidine(1402)-2'-O)-methyltransferase [Acidobacteriota bacterium]